MNELESLAALAHGLLALGHATLAVTRRDLPELRGALVFGHVLSLAYNVRRPNNRDDVACHLAGLVLCTKRSSSDRLPHAAVAVYDGRAAAKHARRINQ